MSTEINIINNYHCEITKERNPNDEWSADDTATTNHIEGFEIISEDDKYKSVDLVVDFDIDPDKTYYLVYVIYSTGDSFSHHTGKIDYIELYEKADMAKATKKMIEDAYKVKDKEDRYSIEIMNNSGSK